MTDKIGALVIDIQDKTLSAEDSEVLNHPLVGGVILFARNYESREQLTSLCRQIRSSRKSPLLIMVDQEGGRVQRFITEFTRLPFMGEFGKLHDVNPARAYQLAKDCGWLMATELLSTGVDNSLCPVLDLNKGMNSVIGERAFHARPKDVVAIASAFMLGMREAGMPATGKHFPGHGSVTLDSHVASPVDERSLDEIREDDMQPFAGMIKAGISAIMAAHIIFPKVDSQPVGYSRYWLKDVLRQHLGFNGVILSDDLSMEGANISGSYTDRVMAAREAGCDFVLPCNNRKAVVKVLDELPIAAHMINKEKYLSMQADYSKVKQDFEENIRWKKTRDELKQLIGQDTYYGNFRKN